MSRRANFHGFLRDVDSRQFLELVIHARKFFLDVFFALRNSLLDPGDVQERATVGAASTFFDLFQDTASDVVTCEQFWWSTCAIKTNGTLLCWGNDFYGQLGNGAVTTGDQTTPIQIGTDTDWAKISGAWESFCAI